MAVAVDVPETEEDFDDVRWYLLHRNVRVLIDPEDDWYVAFDTPCERLGKDGQCLDYENRPELCRDYPHDGEPCEFEGGIFVEEFSTVEEFDAWREENAE
jgi:Fe-S-cluster containining protein